MDFLPKGSEGRTAIGTRVVRKDFVARLQETPFLAVVFQDAFDFATGLSVGQYRLCIEIICSILFPE